MSSFGAQIHITTSTAKKLYQRQISFFNGATQRYIENIPYSDSTHIYHSLKRVRFTCMIININRVDFPRSRVQEILDRSNCVLFSTKFVENMPALTSVVSWTKDLWQNHFQQLVID